MFSFNSAPKETPEEQMKKWKRGIRKEKRGLERQIRKIEREEAKVKREIKKAAKKGDMDIVKTLAKELVRSRNAKNRIRVSATTLNSVELQLTQNYSMVKMSGAIQQSTGVMEAMGRMVRMPEIAATMRKMAMEMERAGLIEEMIDDMVDMGEEDMSSEAEEEVSKVIDELMGDKFATTGAVPTARPAAAAPVAAPAAAEGGKEAEDGELAAMRTRLAALDGI